MVTSAPDKNLELDSIDVSVKITADDIKEFYLRNQLGLLKL